MKKRFVGIGMLMLMIGLSAPAGASHSWGGYHWARQSNPFALKLGDNVSSLWDGNLALASSDWSQSTVLDTTIVTGQAKGNCRPTKGRVEVCNKSYGFNGWLGVAQIWLGGNHITQGIVKMNDSYMSSAPYNTNAWRQFVMCQEIGHAFGLDHQDENFGNANLGTCMDYTNDPSTNQHPNQHDYGQLVTIYSHLDSSTTVGQSVSGSGYSSSRSESYDSSGNRVITWTLWTR